MLTDTLTGQDVDYRIDNPIGIDGLPGVEERALFPVFSGLFLVGRRHRGRGRRRPVPPVPRRRAAADEVVPLRRRTAARSCPSRRLLPEWVGGVVFFWLLLALPVAIAVAVLRYRLDGIDVVINRTLVYGTLTAVVVGIYVLVVGYLGVALRREDDLLVSLVATGIVAVLFAPLRDRLQRAVSRLLYGQRAEPYAALSRLGERLESTLAPDAVLPAIVSTVRGGAAAAVRRHPDRRTGSRSARRGAVGRAPATCRCCTRTSRWASSSSACVRARSGFSPADRRLLADLARQAGVAVSAVRLTADLQRSRERLVSAREEERRRLRRDLHDGLGAQLAGLTVQTGVLRGSSSPRDPEAADALAARTARGAADGDRRHPPPGPRAAPAGPGRARPGRRAPAARRADRLPTAADAGHRRGRPRTCPACRPRWRSPPTGSCRRR